MRVEAHGRPNSSIPIEDPRKSWQPFDQVYLSLAREENSFLSRNRKLSRVLWREKTLIQGPGRDSTEVSEQRVHLAARCMHALPTSVFD